MIGLAIRGDEAGGPGERRRMSPAVKRAVDMDGWPLWARILAWFATQFGIPAVGAGVLLWFVLSVVAKGMNDHQALLQLHEHETVSTAQLLAEHLKNEEERTHLTLQILRNMCVKLAKDSAGVAGCWEGQQP